VDKHVLVRKATPCIVNLVWGSVSVNLDGMVSIELRLGLWCVTLISTIFQLYHGGK
jgi:hypothetical protein